MGACGTDRDGHGVRGVPLQARACGVDHLPRTTVADGGLLGSPGHGHLVDQGQIPWSQGYQD